jgi:excisionase family DNA binding protein
MATNTPNYLTVEELAEELRLPVQTIYAWRYKGAGPRSLKVGRHVRYRRSDVDQWLEDQADRPA